MSMTPEEALADVNAARAVLNPPLEGYTRLLEQQDLDEPALNALREGKAVITRRLDRLRDQEAAANRMIETTRNLLADGHPAPPHFDVPDSILADMQDNVDAQLSALQTFRSNKAVDLGLNVSAPVPK